MVKYIIIVLVLIFAVLLFLYVTISSPSVYRETVSFSADPHLYNNPDRSIKNIKFFVFYFVPKNRAVSQFAEWKKVLRSGLEKLVAFHSLQLRQTSRVYYTIYPESVIGLQDDVIYDTAITQYGNSQALVRVAEEIEDRVFDPAGDLYRQDYSPAQKGEYPILLILYEGVGASGGIIYDSKLKSVSEVAQKLDLPESVIHPVEIKTVDSFLLLNREYMTQTQNADIGTTLLIHEFYHTLGVPDGYKEEEKNGVLTALSTSNDIMGLGRTRPIGSTYLSKEVLNGLGL